MHKSAENLVYILSDLSLPVVPLSSAETTKSRFIKTKTFQPESEGESKLKKKSLCREHSVLSNYHSQHHVLYLLVVSVKTMVMTYEIVIRL